MIKVIAFDLVGVLVNERDIVLSNEEEKLERLFGPNLSDEDYLKKAKEIIYNKKNIVNITKRRMLDYVDISKQFKRNTQRFQIKNN